MLAAGTQRHCPHAQAQAIGCLPPVHALVDLGRPAAELLLIPCLKQDVGGIGDLGDITEGHGIFREREMCIPHHARDPSRDSASPTLPPSPCAYPPRMGRGTEIWHRSFWEPRVSQRVGKASGVAAEPLCRSYLEDKGVEVVGHLEACAPPHLLHGGAGDEQLRLGALRGGTQSLS